MHGAQIAARLGAFLLILEGPRPAGAQIQAPTVKWAHGGCYSSWCETGWYSSPAVADLDGDGAPEAVASAYSIVALDGATGALEWRVASGHDRAEPGAESVGRTWPGIATADLDADGDAEVLFATWTQKGSNANGSLYVLSAAGALLHQVPLPAARGSTTWNGALAAPTLADLDGDPDLELVLQTAHSGVVAFDLPGTASARVSWGTGRGSFSRAGTPTDLFVDGFESGTTSALSAIQP